MKTILCLTLVLCAVLYTAAQQYSTTQLAANDIKLLNYALALEHLEATFYIQNQARFTAQNFTDAGYSATTYTYLNLIRDHEIAHVNALSAAVNASGGMPVVACPSYNFAQVVDVATYIGLAKVLEATGVAAYDGAIATITDKNTVQVAATIATVEARHAAFLNTLAGANPFPEARDSTNSTATVASLVAPLGLTAATCPGGLDPNGFPEVLVQLPQFSTATFANGTVYSNASDAAGAINDNDYNTLKYALFLEHLENNFYMQFLDAFNQSDFADEGYADTVYTYVTLVGAHEAAHVAFLTSAIPGANGPCASYNFGTFDSVQAALTTAADLENTGVSAYDGAANTLTDKTLLTAAATIATVEGRHASYLNNILNKIPFPNNFDPVKTPSEVTTIIAPYITGCAANLIPVLPQVITLTPNTAQTTTTNAAGTTTNAAGTTTNAAGTTTDAGTTATTGATASTASTAAASTASTGATASTAAAASTSTTSKAGVSTTTTATSDSNVIRVSVALLALTVACMM